ncbi:MAG: hypothetical protein COA70_05765 [Planctomycetota bacterium]|nr:MAG: hypothetical protein COA70_05765 [Planctomycetota bacterium]
MLTFLLAVVSLAPLGFQEPEPPAPDASEAPEVVIEEISAEEAAAAIKQALKGKDDAVIVATLETVGLIPSKLVTKETAKALKSKSQDVVLAGLQALRYNTDKSSLDLLLKAKAYKQITKDPKAAEAYAYALGQKADKKCLKILTDGLVGTSSLSSEVLKAKVSAIGRIRHKDAVEAIIDFTKTTGRGGRARGGVRNMMKEAERSLMVLTGADVGSSTADWQEWWYDSKGSFKMSQQEWPLDGRAQRQWDTLWMTPKEKEEAAKSARNQRDKNREGDSDSSEEGARPPKRDKKDGK